MTLTSEPVTVVTRADHVPGPEQGQWMYETYAALEDGRRYEVVDGVLYMSPAPNIDHQNIVLEFAYHLKRIMNVTHAGHVFIAPVDVQLAPDIVVQPDVLILLESSFSKITKACIKGAPDLIIEVTSPGTAVYDRRDKYDLYARTGVREYWLVDPATRTVEILQLHAGVYHTQGTFAAQTTLISEVVPAIAAVPVEQFFVSAE